MRISLLGENHHGSLSWRGGEEMCKLHNLDWSNVKRRAQTLFHQKERAL